MITTWLLCASVTLCKLLDLIDALYKEELTTLILPKGLFKVVCELGSMQRCHFVVGAFLSFFLGTRGSCGKFNTRVEEFKIQDWRNFK